MIDAVFSNQVQKQITSLGQTSLRLSLTAVAARRLPRSLLMAAVRMAAGRGDVVGAIAEDSVGLLSLRQRLGNSVVDPHFLLRLEMVMRHIASHQDVGLVHFQTIRRWASEVLDATDLFDALQDTPSLLVRVPPHRPTYRPPTATEQRPPWSSFS